MKKVNNPEGVKPYNAVEGKKQQVKRMFDNIAGKYDMLNHLLSMGIDKIWRRNLISMLATGKPSKILDVATGTGDLAIQASKRIPGASVTGLDISAGMLDIARKKVQKQGLEDKIDFVLGDSEDMPFSANTFDAVTVAFGVRNFENLKKGLEEMRRVLKPQGKVYILEFSTPHNRLAGTVYNFYFRYLLPFIGKVTSKDPKAYKYLYESVQAFPCYEDFLTIMKEAGFKSNKYKIQTLGICSIYTGEK